MNQVLNIRVTTFICALLCMSFCSAIYSQTRAEICAEINKLGEKLAVDIFPDDDNEWTITVRCQNDTLFFDQLVGTDLKPKEDKIVYDRIDYICLLYTSPSPRDRG